MSRILMLHPTGTTPANFAKLVGSFDNFEAVYPQAKNGLRWDNLGTADAGNLLALCAKEGIEFVAGMSSGAFMAARLMELYQFKGAAMVAGGFIKALKPRMTPLLLVHGTSDTVVPYAGTSTTLGARETALVMKWAHGITGNAKRTKIPNTAADGCSAYVDDWEGKVKLYTVTNGGHTWPVGARTVWQPPGAGRVSHDLDTGPTMGEFFRSLA